MESNVKLKEVIDQEALDDFLEFLSNNENYISSGYGAFHTDNHSNW